MKPQTRYFVVVMALALAPLAPAAEPHAYRAARIWVGDGAKFVADGVLIVKDGKVVTVGKRADVVIPADAVVHDLGDGVVIPGLIAAETTVAERGRDDLHALTPHYRAVDGFDPFADYSSVLAGGVTTIQISPGARRLLPGHGSVVKLAGADLQRRMLRDEESLRVVLGDAFKNPPKIYEPPVGAVSVDRPLEPTRPQLAAGLASAVSGLRASIQAARADKSTTDPFLKALASAGTAEKPLRVTTPTAADVQAAFALAKEFDLKLILVDPPVPAPEQLAQWKEHVVGVILDPGLRPGMASDAAASESAPAAGPAGRRGRPNPRPNPNAGRNQRGTANAAAKEDDAAPASPAEAARDLRRAGIKVAIKPVADTDLKEMLYLGGLFATHNNTGDVVAMLTADAASILRVSDRVGSLAAGKDADFVILGGDPLGLHTRVKSVYIDGQPVYEAAAASKQKVIRGARVVTGAGDSIVNGAVLVDGKTIRAVGRDVSTPHDAEERRFAGAVIVPGFIDLSNGLGLGGPISAQVPISTKLGNRLVSGEPGAASARTGGVTTVLLSAQAPSPVLAFKLGDKLRPIADPVAIKLSVKGNLTTSGASLRDTLKAGRAYHDGWVKYEVDLKEYEVKKKEYDAAKPKEPEKKPDEKKEEKKDDKKPEDKKDEKKPEEKKADEKKPEEKKPEEKKLQEPKSPTKPQSVESLEPFRAVFAGKIPVLVETDKETAIRLAVAICRDEFNVRTVLVNADDAWRVADLLAEKQVAVVAGPELVRTIERNETNLPMIMAVRGVPIGFQSQATAGAKNLPLAVGYAVRKGLGADDALRGLCAGPAQFLGLDTVGALAIGKDADLVVLSGMPFELSTRVLAVMIDGQWVYREGE